MSSCSDRCHADRRWSTRVPCSSANSSAATRARAASTMSRADAENAWQEEEELLAVEALAVPSGPTASPNTSATAWMTRL